MRYNNSTLLFIRVLIAVVLFISSVCSLHAQELENSSKVKSIDSAEINKFLWDSYTCEEGISEFYVRLDYCASLASSDTPYRGYYYKMTVLNGDEFLWKNRDYLSSINLRLYLADVMIPEKYYKIGFSWKKKALVNKKTYFFQERSTSIELSDIYDITLHFYEEVQKSEIPKLDLEALNTYLERE